MLCCLCNELSDGATLLAGFDEAALRELTGGS
jgi:hypothetical protein